VKKAMGAYIKGRMEYIVS